MWDSDTCRIGDRKTLQCANKMFLDYIFSLRPELTLSTSTWQFNGSYVHVYSMI